MGVVVALSLVTFFFFKQKTAYEMLRSLVGSEMCIRDRIRILHCPLQSCRNASSRFDGGKRRSSMVVAASNLSLIHI